MQQIFWLGFDLLLSGIIGFVEVVFADYFVASVEPVAEVYKFTSL